MAVLVVTKLLFGNYTKFLPIYHIKRFQNDRVMIIYQISYCLGGWGAHLRARPSCGAQKA